MKKRAWLAYGIFVSIVLVWFFSSTSIIMRISGKEIPQKVKLEDFAVSMNKKPIYYSADITQSAGNLSEDVGIFGWAFAETEHDNSGRYVSYILVGNKNSYEFKIKDFIARGGVLQVYKGKKIPSALIGYQEDFSTLSMEDGLYKLYIYCWENSEDFSLIETDTWFEKNDGLLTEVSYISNKVETICVTEDPIVSFMCDKSIIDDNVLIKGWAFAKGQDCDTQSVFVELTDGNGERKTFSADVYTLFSVAETFEDDRYAMSGFQTNIPIEEMPNGSYTMRVIVQNGEKTWSSVKQRLIKKDDGVETLPLNQNSADTYISNISLSPLSPNTDQPFNHYLDAVGIVDDHIQVQGWAYFEDWPSSVQGVYLQWTDEYGQELQYSTMSIDRPDVAEVYGQQYGKSGFLAHIPLPDISNGKWTMKIILVSNSQVAEAGSYTVTRSGDAIEATPQR